MPDLKPLQEAIWNLHGCGSRWLRSEPIHETFRGATVWQGQVEVFQLYGHTEALPRSTSSAQSRKADRGRLGCSLAAYESDAGRYGQDRLGRVLAPHGDVILRPRV